MDFPSEDEMRLCLHTNGWNRHSLYEMWEDPLHAGKWFGLEAAWKEQEMRERRGQIGDEIPF